MQDVICPVCGNTKGNLTQDAPLHVYLCALCGHSFTILSNSDQEIYDADYFAEDHKNWFENPDINLFCRIEKLLNNLTPAPFSLLDIGCGAGEFLRFLHKKMPDLKLFGVDLVENSYPGIIFYKEDFLLHPAGEQFDVVTGFMIIEHVPEPIKFVQKMRQHLNFSGILILNTINSSGAIYVAARLLKKIGFGRPFDRLYGPHHVQHFTASSLKILVERCGFEIIEHRIHNFPLAAVDLPRVNLLVRAIYKIAVASIFGATNILGGGMNQTVVCRKRATS